MNRPLFDQSLAKRVSAAGVVAVLVVDDPNDAVPVAGLCSRVQPK